MAFPLLEGMVTEYLFSVDLLLFLACISLSRNGSKLFKMPRNEYINDELEPSMDNSAIPSRTISIVGTLGYMAPEIIVLYGQSHDGYTRAIDFWSLGCMMYKLLTGLNISKGSSLQTVKSMLPAHLMRFGNYQDAYKALFGTVDYRACGGILNEHTCDLLQGLLTFQPANRLGFKGANVQAGFDQLINHPFFVNIDWNLIENKQCIPPYVPVAEIMPMMMEEYWIPKTLCEILQESNKSRWCEEFDPVFKTNKKSRMKVPIQDQHFFNSWYYAPSTDTCNTVDNN